MGIAALVLGILGLFTSLALVGGVLGVLAIVFGVIGRGRVKRDEATNGGMALAGIILGTIAALVTAGMLLFASAYNDEINDLNACNQNAATQAQRDACAEQFGEDVTN
jgi:ABC-type Fe3+-siderophore transport system permease subunit